jgi:hypothetical protein
MGGMAGGDPMAGAGGDADSDADDQVVVTICKNSDGSYTVYPGDEPEGGGMGDQDDTGEDDADAMGAGGAAPAGGGAGGDMGGGGNGASPQGIPADSVGAALKAALDIMNADASSGPGGTADDQFAAGFGASKSPTPATGPAQKY